jgi:3-oxoadipate enol-lactonase / 4-carboxymuconolactone decarboxylase
MNSYEEKWERGRKLRARLSFPQKREPGPKNSVLREYKEFSERYALGEIWAREGLELRIRGAVTVAMDIRGGNYDELAIHLRVAMACGLTKNELREIIWHASLYCGAPLARGAFQVASEVLGEDDE